jgi:hypothetical protein
VPYYLIERPVLLPFHVDPLVLRRIGTELDKVVKRVDLEASTGENIVRQLRKLMMRRFAKRMTGQAMQSNRFRDGA